MLASQHSLTCIPLNALSDNLRMVLNEKSSFVIGKFADVNVYWRESRVHYPSMGVEEKKIMMMTESAHTWERRRKKKVLLMRYAAHDRFM